MKIRIYSLLFALVLLVSGAAHAQLVQTDYEAVAASQTNQVMGPVGAAGDVLARVIVIPATTSPGAVTIKDGANTAITIFPGGASSVTTLSPIIVPVGARSTAGAWQISTGTNVSAIGVGRFR